jgi:DNA primase
MWKEVEEIKQQVSLLDYLQRHNWSARQVGRQQEFVGLCPLHGETRSSFYVNAAKNVFYCHGCGQGGDLIRFAQLYFALPFRQTVAQLKQELGLAPATESALLEETARFYHGQLYRYEEALDYLYLRGLRAPALLDRLSIGYAPGGCLRRHLTALGHSFELQLAVGLINREGRDTFFRRVVFACRERGRLTNLYGRSIGATSTHRFLSRPKGGLFAWESVSDFPTVILVEGLFDLAVLWQAGFLHTTSALGTNLTPAQFAQLCEPPNRQVYLAFDADPNQAGQRAARTLAHRLESAGLIARIVLLPEGHDPNSYFAAGATAADFASCLEQSQTVRP